MSERLSSSPPKNKAGKDCEKAANGLGMVCGNVEFIPFTSA